MNKFIFALGAALALTGCASVDRTFGASPSVQVTDLDTLPEPLGDFAYSIGPQEKLVVTVVGAEDLSGEFFTDQTGDIVFPYLGVVKTSGKSPQEAAELISNGLRGRIIINPQVRVIPDELAEPAISVGGEVNKPGSYSAEGKPTLLKMINAAEGLSETAKKEDVLIMRTIEGQQYIGVYNLAAIERGNYPDPKLFPNDIVMVGNSPARARLDDIIGLAPLLTPIVILLDRLNL
jgi:polysaccharide export outer membrane protein